MSKLHASLTPNDVAANQTLTVQFDSEADDLKNAKDVTVQIFEVDDASPLEPKPGKDILVVEFQGELKDNEFTPTKDPKIPKVSGTPDKIKIKVEPAKEVEVPLPGTGNEQGVFELKLKVTIKKPKLASYTAKTPVFVRSFDHFQTQGAKRPVISFVTGASSDVFFKAAQGFWRKNADAVLVKPNLSIKEMLDILDAEGEKFGPWGQINIVAHGNRHSVLLNIFPDSPSKTLHEGTIDKELERVTTPVVSPDSIDGETEVVFRACNFGRNKALVMRIKSEFFDSAKFVKVPKWLQGYFSSSTRAHEFFVEEMLFDRPTKAESEKDEATEIEKQFAIEKKLSPGLTEAADPKVEIPLFTERKFSTQPFTFTEVLREEKATDSNGQATSTEDLIKDFKKRWEQAPLNLHQKPDTSNTKADRWDIKVVKSEITKPDKNLNQAALEDLKGVWFESKDGTPSFQQLSGGVRSIGSKAGDNVVWQITSTGIAEVHCHVHLNQLKKGKPDLNRVEIEHQGDGVTKVGKKELSKAGEKVVVPLPAQISLGKAKIKLRRGKAFKLVFKATRVFLHRRRDMRTFDKSKNYADRPLEKPELSNPQHYDTAN